MSKWIDRRSALKALQVKAQTLYAYVSRERIRATPDPDDPRRSLYNADDVAEIARRRARVRKPAAIAASAMAWGEPAVVTSISTTIRGRIYYRGYDAMGLARSATLEETAALLWDRATPIVFEAGRDSGSSAFEALAAMAAIAEPILSRDASALTDDAQAVVGVIASACGAAQGRADLHQRLAQGWDCHARSAEKIREALVAMADHDLNASAFAVRVAASTGASLAASVLAGLCALSGPRHGGAAAALVRLLDEARTDGIDKTLERELDQGGALPGFGHPLYPGGDPRASILLDGLDLDPFISSFSDAVMAKTGLAPNCDFGLAAMTKTLALPTDAPFRIFLVGRSVGWCAHAIEQTRSGQIIRPRGRYEGAMPRS